MAQQVSLLFESTMDSIPAFGLTACLGLPSSRGTHPAEVVAAAAHCHRYRASSPASLQYPALAPRSALNTGGSLDATGKEGPAWPKRCVFPPLLTKQVAALEVAFQLPVLRPPAWLGMDTHPSSAKASMSWCLCEPFVDCQPFPPQRTSERPVSRACRIQG